jgi:hypothetical protein
MRIELSEAEHTPLEDVLIEGFRGFNGPFIGPHGYKPLRLMVFRDGEDAPCGGIQGHCYARWLHILMVYLPEDLAAAGSGANCSGAWRRRARPRLHRRVSRHAELAGPALLREARLPPVRTLPDSPPAMPASS